jgi:hypothetical protein
VSRWLNEKETAVNTGILDVSFTLSGQLLAEVRRVLVLNVLDNGIPANSVSHYPPHLAPDPAHHLSLLT